jgi:hypothetical protein
MSVDRISPRQPRPAGDTKLVRYEDFIESKIEGTRRMVKVVDLAAALVTLLVCVLVFLLVVTIIEHWIVRGGFNIAERTVLFAILVGAIGWFGYRRVWPLLVHTINPVYAAHTIEHSSPTLKNSLINLLLFRQRRSEVSDAVYRTLEEQAAHGLTRVPVETSVDRSLLIRLGYVLLAVVAFAGLYKVISPKDPIISAERILLPWADIVPASRVTIADVTPGTTTVSRGESVDVSAEVRGIGNDDAVLLRYATDDGQIVGKTIRMKPSADGLRYVCRLADEADGSELVGLTRNLKYRLEAGDARSLDYSINVISAPSILVERVDYHYPPYTGFVDRSVDALGDIRAIEGTRITVHARANGVIRVADVDFDADGRPDVRMAPKETAAIASFELALREDRQTPRHASYVLRFTNEEGRANREPVKHSIAVERDLDPEASVLAPKEKQIDARLDEMVAIEVEARDPDFALSAVRLHGETPGQTVLDELLLKAEHKGKFTTRYSFVAKAHGLHSGDVMQYWIEAADNRAPKPNVVVTEKRRIRVVSADPNRQPPPDQVAQNDRQQRPPEPGKNGGQQNQQKQDNQGQGEKDQGGAADQNNRASEKQNSESGGQQQSGKNDQQQKDQQQKSEQSGQQQNGGEGSKKDQQNSDSDQQQSKDSKGESKSGNSQSGGESKSKSSQGDEQRGGAPKPGENGEGGSQSKPANSSNQQSKDGSQNGQQSKDKQTGAGASGGERSKDGSKPDGARPEKQEGEKGRGGEREKGQQQAKSEDQKRAVSSEGDNDGEAFERIQKRMEQSGELKKDADNAEGEKGREGEGEKGKQEQGQQQPGKEQQGTAQQGDPQQAKQPGKEQGKQQTAGEEKQQDGKSSNGESAADAKSAQKPEQQSGDGKQKQQQPGKDGGDAKQEAHGKNTSDNAAEKNKQQSGEGAEKNKSPEGQEAAGKGPGGAGEERAPQGSPQSQPDGMKPVEKRQQSGSKKESTNKQEPPSGGGKKESESSGDQGGDKAGGGEEGAGQKAPREGTGSPGQHQSADEGKGQSAEKGKGDTSSSGGQDREADHKTGSSDGKTPGKGSQQKDGAGTQQGGKAGDQNTESPGGKNAAGEKGDQAGSKEGEAKGTDSKTQQDGKQEGEKGRQGEKEVGKQSDQKGDENAQKGESKDSKQQGNQGGQSSDGGQPGQPVAPQHSITGSAPEGDAANLEYARKQTDLVLGKLADQLSKNKVDDKMLKDLGWSRDDLKRFVDRWQQRKDAAQKDDPTGEAAKRDLDDALRSLGLRRDKLQQNAVQKDSMRDLKQGYRGAVPLEYQERLRAYNQGVSRATREGE